MQIITKSFQMFPFELGTIIHYNVFWDAKSTDDILPDEFLNTSLCDGGNCVGFSPFGKIFACYYDEFFLCLGFGEWSEYVEPPLCEWLSGDYTSQLLRWMMLSASKLLTFVAFLDITYGVLLHFRPIIALSDSFMIEWSSSQMLSTNTFVDF